MERLAQCSVLAIILVHFLIYALSSPDGFLFVPSTHTFFLFLFLYFFSWCFRLVPSTHTHVFLLILLVFLLFMVSYLYRAHTFFCFCFCISFHDGGFLFVLNTHIFSSFFSFSSASWFPAKDELGYSAKLDLMLIILFAELLHSSGCARCIIYFRLP